MAKNNSKSKKAAAAAQNAQNLQNYEINLENYYNQKHQDKVIRKLKDENSRDQYIYNKEINAKQFESQVDAFERSTEIYENNLKSIDFYAKNASDRIALGLDEEIASLAFEADDLTKDFERKMMISAYGDREQQQILESSVKDARNEKQQLEAQKLQEKASFDAELGYIDKQGNAIAGKLDLALGQKRSETVYGQIENQIESLTRSGSARAQGGKGRSVQKALKTITAVSGLNAQKMADTLYYDKKVYSVEKTQKLADKLAIFGGTNQSGQEQKGLYELRAESVTNRQTRTSQQVESQRAQIQTTLGIDEEEYNMSLDKLAESVMSSAESSKIKLQDVQDKKFEAQNQAYGQKMLAPKEPPKLPKPYKTPKTNYVKPKRPIKVNKAAMGMGVNTAQSSPSTASTALGIGSAVAGIGAALAPATGGLSLGLTAAASGMGFLSKLFG